MKTPSYSYSTDEENYYGEYSSRDQAAMAGFEENEDCQLIFTGENIPPNPQDKIDADAMFERMRECHEDTFGIEQSDQWSPEDSPHLIELESMLGAALFTWMEKYNQIPKFFTVHDVIKHERQP